MRDEVRHGGLLAGAPQCYQTLVLHLFEVIAPGWLVLLDDASKRVALEEESAGKLIAVDTQAFKFDLARKLGATECVNARDGDPVAAVQGLTGGGADFVFECLGSVQAVQQAIAMTGRGGTTSRPCPATRPGTGRPRAWG